MEYIIQIEIHLSNSRIKIIHVIEMEDIRYLFMVMGDRRILLLSLKDMRREVVEIEYDRYKYKLNLKCAKTVYDKLNKRIYFADGNKFQCNKFYCFDLIKRKFCNLTVPKMFDMGRSVLFIKYENFKGVLYIVNDNKEMEWYDHGLNKWVSNRNSKRGRNRMKNVGYYSHVLV